MKTSISPDYRDRIKALRQKFNLTQMRLSALIGVSFASVNRWENGQAQPSALAWQKIARAEMLGLEALGKDFAPEKPGQVRESQADYSTQPVQTVLDFSTPADVVRLVAEGERLAYGHQFNPAFAAETSRIDPLPHQRIAVYDHMLKQPRLRFLLADDARAGKTIMAGLYIREMLARRGGKSAEEDEESASDKGESDESESDESVFRLKAWNLRKRNTMGFEAGEDPSLARLPMFPELPALHETCPGSGVPLIDQVHRLMHLWRAGDVVRVDDYLDRRALRRNPLFHQLLQALVELSTGEERSLLENISNHIGAGGKKTTPSFFTS